MIKGRVPALLPKIGRAVICNGKYAVQYVGKLNIRVLRLTVLDSAITFVNQFCFETGCFV